eukprot:9472282-Pyramimonas_sp.AAC.1
MSCKPAKVSQSQKPYLSSDCTLQLECMKVESLVIAGQHTAVNTFPGLVHTARHTMEVDSSLSRYSNPLGRGCRRQDEYSAFFVSQEACFRRRQRTPRYGLLAQVVRAHP